MNNNEQIKPKGFFVNLEWDETIQNLNNIEAGQLFKNMFNYSLGRNLLKTSKTVTVISNMAVFPTIDFNVKKYQNKVETNRENGKKGGRKSKNDNIGIATEPQHNPMGYIIHPEEAKEKEKEIVKDKCIKNETIDYRIIDNDNPDLAKFKKLCQLDTNQIVEKSDKMDISRIRLLVAELGWDKFYHVILGPDETYATELLSASNAPALFEVAEKIKSNYPLYFEKLINGTPNDNERSSIGPLPQPPIPLDPLPQINPKE